jgi:DNA mismatch repair protein PMS2
MLEVIDNGDGISPKDFDRLCKAHCTSKLAGLADFNSLTSYGFRGEALNALAALSFVHYFRIN